MVKKHQSLEQALEDYAQTIHQLANSSRLMVNSEHPERWQLHLHVSVHSLNEVANRQSLNSLLRLQWENHLTASAGGQTVRWIEGSCRGAPRPASGEAAFNSAEAGSGRLGTVDRRERSGCRFTWTRTRLWTCYCKSSLLSSMFLETLIWNTKLTVYRFFSVWRCWGTSSGSLLVTPAPSAKSV